MSVAETDPTFDTIYRDLKPTNKSQWDPYTQDANPNFKENVITFAEPPIYKVHPVPGNNEVQKIIDMHSEKEEPKARGPFIFDENESKLSKSRSMETSIFNTGT